MGFFEYYGAGTQMAIWIVADGFHAADAKKQSLQRFAAKLLTQRVLWIVAESLTQRVVWIMAEWLHATGVLDCCGEFHSTGEREFLY
jgi:hypothetical protein